jgi:WD40 repeat protein
MHDTFYTFKIVFGPQVQCKTSYTHAGIMLEHRFQGHSDVVGCLAISDDNQLMASGSHDTTIKLWCTSSGQNMCTLRGHKNRVTCLGFNKNRTLLASGGLDKAIKIWGIKHPEKANMQRTLRGHADEVYTLSFATNGQTLVSTSWDKTAITWCVRTGKRMCRCTIPDKELSFETWTPNGERVPCSMEKWVEFTSCHGVAEIYMDLRQVTDCFAPCDQRHRVMWRGVFDREAHVLYYVTKLGHDKVLMSNRHGKHLRQRALRGHTMEIRCFALSPDGKYAASGSRDQTVRVWELNTGRQVRILHVSDSVECVMWTPDREYVVSGSRDGAVNVWCVGLQVCCKLVYK